ncbi:branched-chain amino acid ABC transporter permease [Streptomyces viridochromogenes]|uniref:Putative Amino acid/amide ABC transporter membrane protein 1, HAAT family n=1 Tax=Streptomyces viridochromogenes Tue57 TaxID=1160705 RepID=L8P4I9_STRVR|nr:branched-chain amino acid ABC transporter permease [Streptomyces viridochromogenes]ELS51094.1 putative Amino acid/amide ABC transporter membrane protein 1, HAAT family [Streptomyces viridochromogenes Tue57]
MNHFIQLVLDGLFVGSFYALVALGYSMVYGIIKLLNFAHGDIYMLGAFAGFTVLSVAAGALGSGLIALVVVMLIAMVATGTLGVVLERVAYRPLRNAPRLSVLITAVGASFALEYGVAVGYGPTPEVYPIGVDDGALDILGARITYAQLAMMAIAVALMIALDTLVRKTRSGRAMRAIAQDPKACLLMGVKVDRVISRTFFLGSALAGAAGVMAGAYYGKIDFLMGFIIGLKAFTAAVIGGIGNLRGAVLGAIVLGLLESFGVYFLGSEWRDVFAFGFLILFLTVRPTGLLGERVTERV